jgi:hypothetical protein
VRLRERLYDARLRKNLRKLLWLFILLLAAAALWIYWNRPPKVDMAAYVPAESLAFLEADDLPALANGISRTEAWRALAAPLGAPERLVPQPWLISLARYTGIGSAESVLLARSQFALCFTQAQATESGNTLTIRPIAALIIETHTSQRRMQPAIEKYVEQFARRAYGTEVSAMRKNVDGVELVEWSAADATRKLVLTTIDTVAIIGNEESVVTRCVGVHAGKHRSLAEDAQLGSMRQQVAGAHPDVLAFVPKAGVKAVIQAWALSRAGNSSQAAAIAPLISNTFGNLIDAFTWSSRFDDAGAEDHCLVALAPGVSQQIPTIASGEPFGTPNVPFAPGDATSVTLYKLSNPQSFWRELNAVISSHSDVVGAIAARPLLNGLLEPYGISDADAFFAAIGPHLRIIRLESSTPAVLVAEALDKQALRKLAEQRVGTNAKAENLGQAEMMVSATDNWSAAFVDNYFLTGPDDAVRHCLEANARGELLTAVGSFRRAQSLVDLSLPIFSLSFADDKASAISFVELFSKEERSAFSTNAAAIQQGAASLEFSASVTTVRNATFEWTSRSSFGLLGSLLTTFAPEKRR